MKNTIFRAAMLGLGAVALLGAASFWTAKPYTEWDAEEVGKMLSDSPWARPASVKLDFSSMQQGRGGMGGPGGGMGGPGGGMGGPGGGMGGPGGGMGGPGGGMGGPGGGMGGPGGGMRGGAPDINAVVMWRSALPVRQAMLRGASLKNDPAADQLAKQLDQEPEFHILAVTGLPAMNRPGMGRPGMGRGNGQEPPEGASGRPQLSDEQREEMRQRMEETMLENTHLVFGKNQVAPEKMETVEMSSGRVLVFYFAKDIEIGDKYKEVRFETQMGPMKLTAKFRPRDMEFAGGR